MAEGQLKSPTLEAIQAVVNECGCDESRAIAILKVSLT
jgi:hypothetical protein